MNSMRIAIVDESASRASIIEEGLVQLPDCELFVLSERHGLLARIEEIAPDIVLIDLGNPSRDVLEEYFAVSRALARPIAMFVDESDEEAIGASIDAGVSVYVVDGFAAGAVAGGLPFPIQAALLKTSPRLRSAGLTSSAYSLASMPFGKCTR